MDKITRSPDPGVDWLSGSTRRPGQRGQHDAPTGNILGGLDQEFLERDIYVDIVEFEVEGGPHVGGADDARGGVVAPVPLFSVPRVRRGSSSAGRWQPAMAHLTWTLFWAFPPILQQQPEEGGRTCAQGVQRQLVSWLRRGNNPCTQVVLGKDSHTGKEPVNAENTVRTTGVLTAGRNRGDSTDPVRQP